MGSSSRTSLLFSASHLPCRLSALPVIPLLQLDESGSPKLPRGPRPRPHRKHLASDHLLPLILHLRVGHRTLVLLGSHQVAKEILNKRSNNYSSRPRLVVAEECVAKGLDTALLPYGERWRRFHAVQTTFLNSRKSQLYRPLQELESRHLLFDLLSTNDFGHELYRYSSSLMYALLYGRRFTSGKDPKLKELERLFTAMFETMSSTTLGNWVVLFPFIIRLPRQLAP
ncbi:hypothetical protein G7Y79_00020g049280 [Physcia stellaris]|nr:hypothetical protein G7Y79_00020g049280 [Physcia stellaris]